MIKLLDNNRIKLLDNDRKFYRIVGHGFDFEIPKLVDETPEELVNRVLEEIDTAYARERAEEDG